MGRNTSVSIGDYFENFVDNSVSEVDLKCKRSYSRRITVRRRKQNIALKMPSRRNRQWHCKDFDSKTS
jgi:hypothetical protein